MKSQKFETIEWPAQSPDLNPIENLWSIVNGVLKNRKPSNLDDLFELLKMGWDSIKMLERLADSMIKRCQLVVEAKGGHIPY